MVDTYGRWTYEKNTPVEKKCDCDLVADWITSTGYTVKTTIEHLTEMVISFAEEWYNIEEYGGFWRFKLDEVINYVELSGGLSEFDYYG